jgi:hypothetical protein
MGYAKATGQKDGWGAVDESRRDFRALGQILGTLPFGSPAGRSTWRRFWLPLHLWNDMRTYILGPFLALLPMRWRKALPFSESINWAHACTLSGLAELAVALAALLQWYSISMTTWVSRGLQVALNGGAGTGITDQAIGGMAWFMWVNHPLTWVIGYFSVEGAARMCGAAFSDSLLGTLPLFLVDKTVRVFFGGSKREQEAPGVASSFVSAIGEKMLESSVALSADQISRKADGTEEIMEVLASRRKPDWDPPRLIRFQENYYRLEACSKCAGPRPFRYKLRKLSAGVPSRKVLVYQPEGVAFAGER